MQLIVLGCYSPYPPADGACSGYLLQNENLNCMLDCGHGTFAQLQKYINFRELHTLIITHFHPDHYADIHALRQAFLGAFRDGSRKDPLIVYAPSKPEVHYEELSSWRDVFITIPLEEAMLRENKFGNIGFNFFPTNHPMPCFGVRVNMGKKIFTYTSDTAWASDLIEQCQDSNILLAEASLRETDMSYASKGHLTAKQAGLLAQKSAAKKLILTHLWPEYNLNQLKREAEVSFDGPVELAQMGKVYSI